MHEIFDLLIAGELLSPGLAKVVRHFCERWQLSGFHGLLETHIFDEGRLADCLARLLEMERVLSFTCDEAGADARAMIPFASARAWECFPSSRDGRGRLTIIVADPTRQDWLACIGEILAMPLGIAVGTRSEIIRAINEYYPLHEQMPLSAPVAMPVRA